MENKLQELTDRLYKEGLSKGKAEGEELLAKAEEKAARIVEDALKKAEEITKKAENDARDFRVKVEGDVRMAATQSIQTVKKGWRVHHNQHWMNTKADSIEAHIKPEDIAFAMNGLNTQPSEELNKLVGTSLDGLTKLVVACADAYTKIAGGGAQADVALTSAKKVLEYFSSKGGDLSKATVTADTVSNLVKVTDGATCVSCDAAGNCSDCTPSSDAARTSAK